MFDLLKYIERVDKQTQKRVAKKIFITTGLASVATMAIGIFLSSGNPHENRLLVRNTQYAKLSQLINSKLEISEAGRQLIETYEGKHLEAYLDPVGIPTIGYGHTKGVKIGQTITEQQAIDFLNQDIKTSARGILTHVNTPLTQGQFDALVSFHFNLGPNILESDKVLLNAINSNNWSLAKKQMLLYVKAGEQRLEGLVKRRQAEVDLIE